MRKRRNWFIIGLLLAVVVLRIPSLFEPYWYGDEAVYLSVGLALKNGALLYRDIFDNKPPLIYIITLLSGTTLLGFKIWLTAFMLGSTYCFYRLVKIGTNNTSAIIASILFVIGTTARFLEGNIANGELFFILPGLAGMYLVVRNITRGSRKAAAWLGTGVIFGLGLMCKATAVADMASLIFVGLFFREAKEVAWQNKVQLLVGYVIPFGFVSVFFALNGAFIDFINTAFLQMFGYLSSWQTGSQSFSLTNLLKTDLAIRSSLLAILLMVVTIIKVKDKKSGLGLWAGLVWFGFSLWAATLSSRPYAHYLLQMVAPTVVLIILALHQKKVSNFIGLGIAGLLLVLAFNKYRYWVYPTASYYANFIAYSLGQKDRQVYIAYFDGRMPGVYQIAQVINEHKETADGRLFVWSEEAALYLLTNLPPATRYVAAYHAKDVGTLEEVVNRLIDNPPEFMVFDENQTPLPGIGAVISGYNRLQTINNQTIYQKKITGYD